MAKAIIEAGYDDAINASGDLKQGLGLEAKHLRSIVRPIQEMHNCKKKCPSLSIYDSSLYFLNRVGRG